MMKAKKMLLRIALTSLLLVVTAVCFSADADEAAVAKRATIDKPYLVIVGQVQAEAIALPDDAVYRVISGDGGRGDPPGWGSRGNVLVNPGFETGAMGPWYQDAGSGPEPWNVTSAEAHSGSYCATTVGNNRIRQDFAPVPTADITEVSFWIMEPGPGTTAYAGWFLYENGSSEQVGTTFPPNGLPEWTFVDMTAHLDPGKNLVAFGVWGYSGGGPAEDRSYLDDVTIVGGYALGDLNCDGAVDMRRPILTVTSCWPTSTATASSTRSTSTRSSSC
jgi:hypothetical protein